MPLDRKKGLCLPGVLVAPCHTTSILSKLVLFLLDMKRGNGGVIPSDNKQFTNLAFPSVDSKSVALPSVDSKNSFISKFQASFSKSHIFCKPCVLEIFVFKH